MEGSLNIPCARSRNQGGLNKIDLHELAKSVSFKKPRAMPKRELCSALNMINEPKKANTLAKILDQWQVNYTWNIEKIFHDQQKLFKGKKHVLVKWVGFPRKTYIPVENIVVEHVAQSVLSDLDMWRDRCGQLGYIEQPLENLEEDQLPFEDAIMSQNFIAKDDIVRVDDRCWSRVALQSWIKQFIDKTDAPTNPVTRKVLRASDLIDAGVNPKSLMHFNRATYRLEKFDLKEAAEASEKRKQDEKRGIVQPPDGRKFIQVSVGYDHALALLDDGTVFGWGSDENAKISGAYVATATLQRNFDGELHFVAVSAGRDHSLGLLNSGHVVGWGQNNFGQFDAKKFSDESIYYNQIVASAYFSMGLLNDGRVVTWGRVEFVPLKTKRDVKYTFISAGTNEAAAVTEDGLVYAAGDPIASFSTSKKAKKVAVGNEFVVVMNQDGTLDGWNLPKEVPKSETFIDVVAAKYILALDSNGHCFAFGKGAPKVDQAQKFKNVSASWGTAKSAGVLIDGSIALF